MLTMPHVFHSKDAHILKKIKLSRATIGGLELYTVQTKTIEMVSYTSDIYAWFECVIIHRSERLSEEIVQPFIKLLEAPF